MFSSKYVNDLNFKWDELIERGNIEFKQGSKVISILADGSYWYTYDNRKCFGIKIINKSKVDIQNIISKEFKRLKIIATENEIYITLENNLLNEHFKNLLNFIINKIYLKKLVNQNSIEIFFEELNNAKDLLSSENLPNKLGAEKQIGLYGELYFLNNILIKKLNIRECILSWTGPSKKHDFSLLNLLIEIKTTSVKSNNKIRTSSTDQLSPIYEKKLFLNFLKFEKKSNGRNLNEIVNEIEESIQKDDYILNEFNLKLMKVGYFKDHKTFYDEKFSLLEEKYFYIDKNFPYLEKKKIPYPDSIEEIQFTYTINLDKCNQSKINKSQLIDKI